MVAPFGRLSFGLMGLSHARWLACGLASEENLKFLFNFDLFAGESYEIFQIDIGGCF